MIVIYKINEVELAWNTEVYDIESRDLYPELEVTATYCRFKHDISKYWYDAAEYHRKQKGLYIDLTHAPLLLKDCVARWMMENCPEFALALPMLCRTTRDLCEGKWKERRKEIIERAMSDAYFTRHDTLMPFSRLSIWWAMFWKTFIVTEFLKRAEHPYDGTWTMLPRYIFEYFDFCEERENRYEMFKFIDKLLTLRTVYLEGFFADNFGHYLHSITSHILYRLTWLLTAPQMQSEDRPVFLKVLLCTPETRKWLIYGKKNAPGLFRDLLMGSWDVEPNSSGYRLKVLFDDLAEEFIFHNRGAGRLLLE